jgi:Fur family peroxide stress response transcriptional regulator
MKNVSETLTRLKKLGYRLTPQREAILRCLCGDPSHPCAEDIFRKVRIRFPMMSLATVYNTLRVMEDIGEVRCIRAGRSGTRYDTRIEPHGHFICQNCGDVIDIEADAAREVMGHLVQNCEVTYRGLCTTCRSPRLGEGSTRSRSTKPQS